MEQPARTCPKCGSDDYLFRGRKKVEPTEDQEAAVETSTAARRAGTNGRYGCQEADEGMPPLRNGSRYCLLSAEPGGAGWSVLPLRDVRKFLTSLPLPADGGGSYLLATWLGRFSSWGCRLTMRARTMAL
jgi:hypothetical protein